MPRTHDVVVFGATGFTGKLVAEYIARKHAPGLRWAIAGRSGAKLAGVRSELLRIAPALAALDVLVADSADASALADIAKRTRVVCTTIGPYMKYGLPLARVCAENGTSYCDLAGEVLFIRRSIDENHERARATGARIVHSAGFDSIPSDLGVLLLHEAFRARGKALASAAFFCGPLRGSFSGGTVASMMETLDAALRDRDLRRLVGDPYALLPDRKKDRGPDGRDQRAVRYEPRIGQWTGPFVMAAINTRVVRRSNALQDFAYGKSFAYSEAMTFGRGPKGLARAAGFTAALGAFFGAASFARGRKLLAPLLPAPGQGPSQAARDAGFFKVRIVGEGDGLRLDARVEGTSDPGYGETAKMLGEAAVCLAQDEDALPRRYGVLTPASAMGLRLVDRLRAAGMTFETREVGPTESGA
jgi:short subunit dehydrogenase-like uncharacterized protein